MVEKAKIFYFTVFVLVVFALVFHITAMGHHHWKKAESRNITSANKYGFNYTSIGLFTRCLRDDTYTGESCFPNKFPGNTSCNALFDCRSRDSSSVCNCDYLPSTKGMAACTIIAAIFLGVALIILFVHSINTTETRSMGIILGLFPLILLLLAFLFILTALILVGSYLSRDMMHSVRRVGESDVSLGQLRDRARDAYKIRVDWSTGLEIISLFFTFLSLLLYSAFVFKFGRSP